MCIHNNEDYGCEMCPDLFDENSFEEPYDNV